MFNGEVYIFGAKSTAIGLIRAIKANYTDCEIKGCIVSSLEGNPDTLEGYKVVALKDFAGSIPVDNKNAIQIIIATPIYVQGEIRDTLKNFGFTNVIALDTDMEEKVMSEYYQSCGLFSSIKSLSEGDKMPSTYVLKVNHHKDIALRKFYTDLDWVHDIQVGAIDTDQKIADINDAAGDNISHKNALYCEETALYWMWKNMLENKDCNNDYYGIFQYRRILNITDEDLMHAYAADVDVILPYPMIHVPDINEHHTRYTNEQEWDMLLKAMEELHPEYMEDYENIFSGQYMYNYNMFVGKKEVIREFCEWIFPVMFRTEELCEINNIPFCKRYIAYFAESLTTWYFLHNASRLNIKHTGRLLRF